jgi:solute carrier family 25 carnitine/acylcarnitine transporter 20/29
LGRIVTTPTELIKIRQQQQVPGATMSARGVAVNILKSAGVRGLYRGGVATALRDCG